MNRNLNLYRRQGKTVTWAVCLCSPGGVRWLKHKGWMGFSRGRRRGRETQTALPPANVTSTRRPKSFAQFSDRWWSGSRGRRPRGKSYQTLAHVLTAKCSWSFIGSASDAFFYKSQLTRKPSSITVPWWMQPPYKAFQASACRHHCNPSHHRQVKHHPSNAERLSIIHLFKPSYYKCWGGGLTNTNIISASIWCKISYGCFWLRLAALETLISHYTAGADARTPGSFGWSPKTSTKT